MTGDIILTFPLLLLFIGWTDSTMHALLIQCKDSKRGVFGKSLQDFITVLATLIEWIQNEREPNGSSRELCMHYFTF